MTDSIKAMVIQFCCISNTCHQCLWCTMLCTFSTLVRKEKVKQHLAKSWVWKTLSNQLRGSYYLPTSVDAFFLFALCDRSPCCEGTNTPQPCTVLMGHHVSITVARWNVKKLKTFMSIPVHCHNCCKRHVANVQSLSLSVCQKFIYVYE